jgi:hypothetical protein
MKDEPKKPGRPKKFEGPTISKGYRFPARYAAEIDMEIKKLINKFAR